MKRSLLLTILLAMVHSTPSHAADCRLETNPTKRQQCLAELKRGLGESLEDLGMAMVDTPLVRNPLLSSLSPSKLRQLGIVEINCGKKTAAALLFGVFWIDRVDPLSIQDRKCRASVEGFQGRLMSDGSPATFDGAKRFIPSKAWPSKVGTSGPNSTTTRALGANG